MSQQPPPNWHPGAHGSHGGHGHPPQGGYMPTAYPSNAPGPHTPYPGGPPPAAGGHVPYPPQQPPHAASGWHGNAAAHGLPPAQAHDPRYRVGGSGRHDPQSQYGNSHGTQAGWPQPVVPPPRPPTAKSEINLTRIFVILLFAVPVVGAVVYSAAIYLEMASQGTSRPPDLRTRAPEVRPAPQNVVDEEMVVSGGASQTRCFSLQSARPIRAVVRGQQGSERGFDVWFVSHQDLERHNRGEQFNSVAGLSAQRTRGFSSTDTIQPGAWCVRLESADGSLDPMTVSVKLTLNPE
jgi:hypothetical protein